MKKILFGILTFFGIGLSFCSAENFFDTGYLSSISIYSGTNLGGSVNFLPLYSSGDYCIYIEYIFDGMTRVSFTPNYQTNTATNRFWSTYNLSTVGSDIKTAFSCFQNPEGFSIYGYPASTIFNYYIFPLSNGNSSNLSIDVVYNNGNSSEEITCDGMQSIEIKGLSTITSTNTFTPYFNINYHDEDNQLLTESYSKDILYLSGGLFKKTYTGNNDWVLSIQGNDNNNSFSGYIPVFDVVFTGDVWDNTGNIFNNFAENSVKFTLSNIPSYIQYVIIIMLLLFIIGFIRKFKMR